MQDIEYSEYTELANRIKLLAHPERLRILDAVRREPECVCHLATLLEKPQPYVSQQLRILRQAGVIIDEKDGLNVYYRLADTEINMWLNHILGEPTGVNRHQPVDLCPCPKCAVAIESPLITLA